MTSWRMAKFDLPRIPSHPQTWSLKSAQLVGVEVAAGIKRVGLSLVNALGDEPFTVDWKRAQP